MVAACETPSLDCPLASTPPPQRLLGTKREAVEALLSCRWAGCRRSRRSHLGRLPAPSAFWSARLVLWEQVLVLPCFPSQPTALPPRHPLPRRSYPLSEGLRQRIATDCKHRSSSGFLCQLCLGICLPSGLLTGTGAWDYDRDMDVLRREVVAVLGRCLAPEACDLREHIDRCARVPAEGWEEAQARDVVDAATRAVRLGMAGSSAAEHVRAGVSPPQPRAPPLPTHAWQRDAVGRRQAPVHSVHRIGGCRF